MSGDSSLGDREERRARLRSKHACKKYKLVRFRRKNKLNGPLIPFYVWITDETFEHLWERATGESNCESAFLVYGVSLSLFNKSCE